MEQHSSTNSVKRAGWIGRQGRAGQGRQTRPEKFSRLDHWEACKEKFRNELASRLTNEWVSVVRVHRPLTTTQVARNAIRQRNEKKRQTQNETRETYKLNMNVLLGNGRNDFSIEKPPHSDRENGALTQKNGRQKKTTSEDFVLRFCCVSCRVTVTIEQTVNNVRW